MDKIVSGEFEGRHLGPKGKDRVNMRWSQGLGYQWLDVSDSVIGYYVADESHRVAAGVGAAAAGAFLLGPVGLAGALFAAKKKRLAVVTWRDKKQSILEIKDKKLHRNLITLATKNGSSLSD